MFSGLSKLGHEMVGRRNEDPDHLSQRDSARLTLGALSLSISLSS